MKEMTKEYYSELLSLLRQFSISDLVSEFVLPRSVGKNWLSDCPVCYSKNTFVISDKYSLCKCMQCKRSFSKIDLIMTVKNLEITEVADFLKTL